MRAFKSMQSRAVFLHQLFIDVLRQVFYGSRAVAMPYPPALAVNAVANMPVKAVQKFPPGKLVARLLLDIFNEIFVGQF